MFYIHITIRSKMLRFFAHKIFFMFRCFSFCEPLESFKDSCHIFVMFLLLFEYAQNYAIKGYKIISIFKILDIFILFVMNIQDCTSRIPVMYFFHLKGLLLCHVCLTCCCGYLGPFFRLWCGLVANSTVIFLL